ncbi:MAG: IS66 family transposase [Sandaracinaceae bacterium]|nr:IS66 family transposase [Sandaracinaceae bacterium]
MVPLVRAQAERIESLERQIAQLQKVVMGPRSEKMPSVAKSLGVGKRTPAEIAATRQERAEARDSMPAVRIEHAVPDADKTCSVCGGTQFSKLGEGRTTSVFEYVPPRIVRHEHVQEVLRCACGECVLTAPGAPKVVEGGRYGASLMAHLAVQKCADSIPIYRIEKDFKRQGVAISRSTMNELFHRAAQIVEPLSTRLLECVRTRPLVCADETSMRMLDGGEKKPKTGYVWTFVSKDATDGEDIAYVFAASRSGETPKEVLKSTAGTLLVDGYAGYNVVAEVASRERAGCYAHVRRRFYDAQKSAPIAGEAIALILEMYRVEHQALEMRIVGKPEHLQLRKDNAAPARARLKEWLDAQHACTPPQSALGGAIQYTLNQWQELGRFLDDAKIPLDNNISERALRRVALGRKNFLFVGDLEAGKHVAGLYSLIATCEARDINPFAYLADVIARVQDHPANKLDELLPGNWASIVIR